MCIVSSSSYVNALAGHTVILRTCGSIIRTLLLDRRNANGRASAVGQRTRWHQKVLAERFKAHLTDFDMRLLLLVMFCPTWTTLGFGPILVGCRDGTRQAGGLKIRRTGRQ